MGSKAVVDALPPPILALFQPRPPLPFLKAVVKRECRPLDGMAHCVQFFEEKDQVPPKPPPAETKPERVARKAAARKAACALKLSDDKSIWNPKQKHSDAGDAYKTLFVGRLSFETDEKTLRREFENYGPVKNIAMIKDSNTGKPRGYAFIEYERERDMRTAFKSADGRKIDNRRCVVDVERGRTVNSWLPRKLGGGLGGTRNGGREQNQTFSGREPTHVGGADERRSDSRREDEPRRRDDSRRDDSRRDERRSDSRRDEDSRRRDRSPRRDEGSRRDRDNRDGDRESRR